MTNHPVVAVILSQADRLLLCHQAPGRRWYPDVWDFPGGHVEPEGRPEEALRREQLGGLRFADPSYLGLLQGLLRE
jgi:8-oxo-dGTP pyrophosphatase MutT (NUDIX family)